LIQYLLFNWIFLLLVLRESINNIDQINRSMENQHLQFQLFYKLGQKKSICIDVSKDKHAIKETYISPLWCLYESGMYLGYFFYIFGSNQCSIFFSQ